MLMMIHSTTSTSEDVVKSLKSSKVSHENKLAIAFDTWNSSDIIFPNKGEYLAEWVTGTVTVATECFRLLAESQHILFRPSFEHLTTLFLNVCTIYKREDIMADEHNEKILIEWLFTAADCYEKAIIAAANTRKVYDTVVIKLLKPMLIANHSLHILRSQSKNTEMIDATVRRFENIVRIAIFVQDFIKEQLSHTDKEAPGNASKTIAANPLTSSLLDVISNIANSATTFDKETIACLSSLPDLLTHSLLGQSTDRNATRNFFLKLWTKASNAFNAILKDNKEHNGVLQAKRRIFEAINKLLRIFENDLYRPGDDAIHEVKCFLEDLSGLVRESTKRIDKIFYLQRELLEFLVLVLKINNNSVETHLARIWPIILMSAEDARVEASTFVRVFLTVYSKSHKLNVYLVSLLEAIDTVEVISNWMTVLKSVVYSNEYLGEFAACVSTQREDEIVELLSVMDQQLQRVYSENLEASKLGTPLEGWRNSGNDKSDRGSSAQLELLIPIFIPFLRSIKVEAKFDTIFKNFYKNYVSPVIELVDVEHSHMVHFIYAALSIHLALSEICATYWVSFADVTFRIKSWTLNDPRAKVLTYQIFMHHIKVVINAQSPNLTQAHANIHTNDVKSMLIADVLEAIQVPGPKITWSGKIRDINADNYSLAAAKVFFVDWLDIICDNDSKESAERITRFIVRCYMDSCYNNNNTLEYTPKTLCLEIFGSAEFYELPAIKKVFFDVCLKEMLFVVPRITKSPSRLFSDLELILSLISTSQDRRSIYSDAEHLFSETTRITQIHCTKMTKANTESDSDDSEDSRFNQEVDGISVINVRLRAIIDLLQLFPLSYFTKSQRDGLMLAAMVVERMIEGGGLECAKTTLACRNLVLKLVEYGTLSILSHSIVYFRWWIVTIIINERRLYQIANTSDNQEAITRLRDELFNVSTSVISKTVRRVLERAQDVYMVSVIEFLKSLSPIKSDAIMTEEVSGEDDILGNDWALSFIVDVIDVCIEHREKVKSNHQPQYWVPLVSLSNLILEQSTQSLQSYIDVTCEELCNNDSLDTKKDVKKFNNIGSLLRAFKVSIKFDNLLKDDETRRRDLMQVLEKLVGFAYKLMSKKNELGDEDIIKNVLTIMSIVAESHNFFDGPNGKDIVEKIISIFWDIFSVYLTKEPAINRQAENIACKFIRSLSREHFQNIYEDTHGILRKMILKPKPRDVDTVIILIDIMIRESKSTNKFIVKKNLSLLISHLCNIDQCETNDNTIMRVLNIFAYLCIQRDFTLEIPGVTSTVHSLLANYDSREQRNSASIFNSVCDLLHVMFKYRRSEIMRTLPPVTAIIYILLNAFKRPSTSSLGLEPSTFRTKLNISTSGEEVTIKSAQKLARLFAEIPQDTASVLSTSEYNKIRSSELSKAFKKHVSFILVEYMKILVEGIENKVKETLNIGLFSLMDLCTEHERDLVMSSLGRVAQTVFKEFWAEYVKEWKYTGRA
ncbi:6257_t:CDS:2 [Paraglomus brasilianum]|uniref:6257_t:CDS:1 n=1 Tax=Paraglomus brasilianum TaxID=144538 RepID=A0A9N8Z3P7_9GLOM|nr:6257_t:CDS:2 [Paraglomus brasilianum]